jgi:DNA repair protein RadC
MIREIIVRETETDLWGNTAAGACRTPADAASVIRTAAGGKPDYDPEKEHFWTILLNSRNKVKSVTLVSVGILDASLVHPREVFRAAVVAGAAAIVICHNHPSGMTEPSAEDLRITRQLIQAGQILGINVLDHVIIGGIQTDAGMMSMREAGMCDFTNGK